MMAEKLQIALEPAPCPFCGSAGPRLVVDPDYVQCVECGATGPECDPRGRGHVPPRASVTAWNTRRPPAAAPRTRNISRVTYQWLEEFEKDGRLALWPEVQSMARELMARRREDMGK
jgi:hypothetical protein